ncbi:hypothetical protein GCM10009737_00500 [Nocardioides lentus]|uniref:Uncharacterized protein n=1 Tax=Nocardioides lentus TaxID=338077 RepID=A0ABP5A7T0_9ACTN
MPSHGGGTLPGAGRGSVDGSLDGPVVGSGDEDAAGDALGAGSAVGAPAPQAVVSRADATATAAQRWRARDTPRG